MAREILTGIYKITNLDNGKMYVGQAENIYKRWGEHRSYLRHNNHSNSRLQNSWNCHGEEKFEFSIIQECSIDDLNDLEMYWIDKLRTYVGFSDCNGYNLTLGGDGTRKFTKEMVAPICELYNSGEFRTIPELAEYLGWESKRVRRYLNFGTLNGMCNYTSIGKMEEAHKVKVICLNTREIFDSVNDAQAKYNVNGVASCCVGNHKYAGTLPDGEPLLWMHLDDYELMSEEEIEIYISDLLANIRAMYVVRLNDRKIFKNSRLAMEDVGLLAPISIQDCCNHVSKYAGKNKETGEQYVWVYYKEYCTLTETQISDMLAYGQITTTNPPKKVICLNTLQVFENPVEAAIWSNTDQERIKCCCRNTTNTVGIHPQTKENLTWMYYEDYLQADETFIQEKIKMTAYKRTNPDKMKKIVCLNNNYLFDNLKSAGLWCGLKNPSQIGYNTRKGKTCGKHPETKEKLCWMYYDDYIVNHDENELIKYSSIKD